MKRVIGSLIAVFLIVGFVGITGSNPFGLKECIAGELGPVVTMGTPLVKMSKKSKAVIMGTGFKPGQEVNILFVSPDGLQSDIGYALKPAPKADKTGSWTSTWSAGRYVGRKLIKGGAYKMVVTDQDYKPIGHTAVYFAKPPKKKKKK